MSESHESIQGPGILNVIATEVGNGWVGESITGHCTHVSTAHMLLLALFTPRIMLSKDERNLNKMQLYQAGHITQTIDRRNYVTAFYLAGCLLKLVEYGFTSHVSRYRSFRRWWGDCSISQDCSCSQC